MGQGHSQEASAPPKQPEVVRIDKSEVPEEYRNVGVSSDVVRRVAAQEGTAPNNAEADQLKTELAREREEKARLREEMAKLSQLQQRKASGAEPGQLATDIEARKKVFDETVERVQKQFFSYQKENVCSDNEKEIMSCLAKNEGRVMKCAPLAELYEKCVGEFRQQVLKGN